MSAGQRATEREFEQSLKLSPAEAHAAHGRGGKLSAHGTALENLGITHGGKLSAVDEHGNLDLHAVAEDIQKFAAAHTRAQVLTALHDAFGTRGERVAASFIEPGSIGQLDRFHDAVTTSPTAKTIQTDLAASPYQQFEQMLANVANIGNTLASSTLSPLNTLLQATNASLVDINAWLKGNPFAQAVGGWGLLIGGVGTALGLFGLAVKGVTTGLGQLGIVSTQAGAGLGALLGGLSRIAGLFGVLSLSGDTPGGDDGRAAAQAKGGDDWKLWQRQHPGVLSWLGDKIFGGADEPAGSPPLALHPKHKLAVPQDVEHHTGLAPSSAPAPAAVTVTINANMSGSPDKSWCADIVAKLSDAIRHGSSAESSALAIFSS